MEVKATHLFKISVSPRTLDVPDIDSYVGLAHTLFALEDLYGIRIGEIDVELCLRLDKSKGMTYVSMLDLFSAWQRESEKLGNDEITKDGYDAWRYNYPRTESACQVLSRQALFRGSFLLLAMTSNFRALPFSPPLC